MEFKKYSQMLMCKMQLFMGNEYELEIREVCKNNNVTMTGVMAKKKGQTAYPTLYIDEFYCPELDDSDVEYLAMRLSGKFLEIDDNSPHFLEEYFEYEYVREHIAVKLINAESNKDILIDVPHRRFHNLAIVYYYIVEDEGLGGRGSILIRNAQMENWQVTEAQLYEAAIFNSKKMLPYSITPIKEVIERVGNINMGGLDVPMYVLTNNYGTFGAACMLYEEALEEFAAKTEGNFYILPCSIHEVILLPFKDEYNVKDLLTTVTEINSTEVSQEYLLADSVYLYDCETKEVAWIC